MATNIDEILREVELGEQLYEIDKADDYADINCELSAFSEKYAFSDEY